MTLDHDTRSLSLDRLGPEHLTETFGFLDRDPALNVYLIALTLRDGLAQPRDEMWAARREGEIVGVLHLGGQTGAVLPHADDPAAIDRLGRHALERMPFLPRRFHVIGPRAATEGFRRRLAEAGFQPRLHRHQIYMALERGALAPFERLPELRVATRDDYRTVFESGAAMRAEELEEDPRQSDPIAYARRAEEECRDGYTFLWTDREGLCFRANMSARTADAVQIAGVFTPPERRGRGLARRGLSELCARLMEKSVSACLFVNDFNAPAIAVYRRLGFRDHADWASAFYDLR
jgi:ribosomal protein S18 acetylase RimI-like enzyme